MSPVTPDTRAAESNNGQPVIAENHRNDSGYTGKKAMVVPVMWPCSVTRTEGQPVRAARMNHLVSQRSNAPASDRWAMGAATAMAATVRARDAR